MPREDMTVVYVAPTHVQCNAALVSDMQLAQVPTLVVTDLAIMKEALVEKADVWSDRPLHFEFLKLMLKGEGMKRRNYTQIFYTRNLRTIKYMYHINAFKKVLCISDMAQSHIKVITTTTKT